MSPVLWFAFVMLGISAICFVADAFLSLGEGAGSSDVRDVQRNVKTPFPPVSGGAEDALGASGLGTAPPEVSSSLPEVLRPIGGLPSWETTRKGASGGLRVEACGTRLHEVGQGGQVPRHGDQGRGEGNVRSTGGVVAGQGNRSGGGRAVAAPSWESVRRER